MGTSSRLQSESSAVEGFCHPAQAQTQRLPVHPHADPGTAAPLLDGNRPGNDNNALDTMGVTEVLSQIENMTSEDAACYNGIDVKLKSSRLK